MLYWEPPMLSTQMASKDATLKASVHKSRGDLVVCMCVQLNRCFVVCVSVLHKWQSGEVCVFTSTLCKYDLRKGDLFVLSWARVQRMKRGSISSELLMCSGGVHSI